MFFSLREILQLLGEIIFYVEASPSWWLQKGWSIGVVIVISYLTYTLRLMVDIVFFRLSFGLAERFIFHRHLLAMIPEGWRRHLYHKTTQVNKHRRRLQNFLHKLDYLGLFIAGLIPLPFLGSIGSAIYTIERWSYPWYHLFNWHFCCLLVGGLLKMTAFVFLWS